MKAELCKDAKIAKAEEMLQPSFLRAMSLITLRLWFEENSNSKSPVLLNRAKMEKYAELILSIDGGRSASAKGALATDRPACLTGDLKKDTEDAFKFLKTKMEEAEKAAKPAEEEEEG